MIPKSEKISRDFYRSLKDILTSNNYRTNIGNHIFVSKNWFDGNNELMPCASVYLEEEESVDIHVDVLKAKLNFNIEVHVRKDDEDFRIFDVLDDLKRCCLLSSQLHCLAHSVEYQGFQIHQPEDGRGIINGKFGVSIVYIENLRGI